MQSLLEPQKNMLVQRSWYSDSIKAFLESECATILGRLAGRSTFDITETQRRAWQAEIDILKKVLHGLEGRIYLEFEIPRMGHRADAILFVRGNVIVLEFKIGANAYTPADLEQVQDYALELKHFHETSRSIPLFPILVATDAASVPFQVGMSSRVPGLANVVRSNANDLQALLVKVTAIRGEEDIDADAWEAGRYNPTPTIIEAAKALFAGHSVAEISRCDASAESLTSATQTLTSIIQLAQMRHEHAICFITGVPGSGKTLLGLNVASTYRDPAQELHSVFLSGNGPLVAVLREALVRDKHRRARDRQQTGGPKASKKSFELEVKSFIQNVHHFRDNAVVEPGPPIDHVTIFDEAQRAWNREHTSKFMRQRRGFQNFDRSEPDFLISTMHRHPDWAVIICLVGEGQEIHVGEAGIGEWLIPLGLQEYAAWRIYLPKQFREREEQRGTDVSALFEEQRVTYVDAFHLSVSMRSFRAGNVSRFVDRLIALDTEGAREALRSIDGKFPIVVSRSIDSAKEWLRDHAHGSERYGIVVSSKAERLKPFAIDVRVDVDPVSWFLNDRDHIKSSYYLEDVATEFQVQGLELDWGCVSWDGDLRYTSAGWRQFHFKGNRWERILSSERRSYQLNAYRVLLTRARQGLVIFIPEGSTRDATRKPEYYDSTFHYLLSLGIPVL